MSAVVQATHIDPTRSVLFRMATRYGIDADKMLNTLKQTAFKGNVSNEQMMALLVVAEQHGLNPWTKEIFAFPSQQGIVPVVSVDGWAKIINTHPSFDGVQFKEDDEGKWIECSIFRKDRTHPVVVREWMEECGRDTGPWKSHPRRMLRHKSLIQCARIAFGFAGIYDPDEAERVIEAEATVVQPRIGSGVDPRPDTSNIPLQWIDEHVGNITDILNQSDKEKLQVSEELNAYVAEAFSNKEELYCAVSDALKERKIINKGDWRKLINLANGGRDGHQ